MVHYRGMQGYVDIHMCIYIYIYIEREREIERESARLVARALSSVVFGRWTK